MSYSKEVLTRARARLAQQKADRESENAARLQAAYTRIPRLKEIDMALVSTMAQAAQAAFLQGSDGKAALEQVRQSNLQLQQERKILVEKHLEPGFLTEEPVCPQCGGTGYVGAAMCQCLKELCVQEQRKEMGAAFQNAGFDSFLHCLFLAVGILIFCLRPNLDRLIAYDKVKCFTFDDLGSLLFQLLLRQVDQQI